MPEAVIVATGRTPIGRANKGSLVDLRPDDLGATIVQVGLGRDAPLPLNTIVAKEITLRGSFRFGPEFAVAAAAIGSGRIDPAPLLTEVLPMISAVQAFELAADRTRAMKVQLAF